MAKQQTPLAKKVSWLSSIIYSQRKDDKRVGGLLDDNVPA
jgi:hypothetical protein